MKKCNNCKFAKIGFALFTCTIDNTKKTAFDTCDRWTDLSVETNVPEFNSKENECMICYRTDSHCSCWPIGF